MIRDGRGGARRRCGALTLGLAVVLALLPPLAPSSARAAEALVAVATNFLDAAKALAAALEAETGHRVTFTAGASGKLYAQIAAGAPFDAFLSADQARPELLEAEGRAVAGSRFTYATGRLALWSADPARIGPDGAAALRAGDFRSLAIANPDLAPYGVAARKALAALGLWETVAPRVVMGQNIGQTLSLVATGNAEMGFVALASLTAPGAERGGSMWVVPAELHAPIRQDAVLLARGAGNAAAREFLAYLQDPTARAIIARHGYGG